MSAQSLAWLRHTQAFLNGADPNLAKLFMHALMHADYPKVSLLDAFEAILADFLAGPHRQRLDSEPKKVRVRFERRSMTLPPGLGVPESPPMRADEDIQEWPRA